MVYGRRDRRYGVLFNQFGLKTYGLVHGFLALHMRDMSAKLKLLLIRPLIIVLPDIGNQAVFDIYGHKRFSHQLSPKEFSNAVLVQSSSLIQSVIIITDLIG